MDKKLSWKDVFNSEHCCAKRTMFLGDFYLNYFKGSEYPYFVWNDRIYDDKGYELELTIEDVE